MITRILVTTDGSDLSRKAQQAAIDLAAKLHVPLVALHVVPRYPMSYFEGGTALEPAEVARIERQWADKGRAMVDAAATQAAAAGVQAHGITAQSDDVAGAILAAAAKHGCDLIVMASHGRRGLGRVLLGSETQQVLTHSAIPVLVLR